MASSIKSSTANGFADWTEFYWKNSKEICAGFFKSNELTSPEKLWLGVEKLSQAEPAVFWAVALHHPNMGKVLQRCIDDADRSHASTKDRVSSGHQACLVLVVTKIVLGFDPSFSQDSTGRVPTPGSVATRLLNLFPGHVVMPLSLALLRHSPSHASTVMCGLFISCPQLLSNFHATTSRLCDTLEDIAATCQLDAKRGRFQRKGAEILALIERMYRALKQLWGLLHSCPFIAEYCSTDRMMSALKLVVDTACPMLQHFIMTCEIVAPRRPQLTKAVASIVNAAVDCASILTLFSRFICGGASNPADKWWDGRSSIAPTIVDGVNDSIHDHMMQHTTGMIRILVSKCQSVESLFAQISTPSDMGHNRKLGPVLIGSVTTSKSTHGGKHFSAGVFGMEYMANLVRHGVTLEGLNRSKFILSDEARQLGGVEDKSATHIAMQDSETPSQQTVPVAASEAGETKQQRKSDDDELEGNNLIGLVRDILPDAPVGAIREALEVYQGDVEKLINEAMMCNLPPHLQAKFDGTTPPEGSEPSPTQEKKSADVETKMSGGAGSGSGGGSTLLPPGLDFGTDMHAFLTSDFHDDALSGGQHTGSGEGNATTVDIPATPQTGNAGMFGNHTFSSDGMSTTEELFGLDDDMKQQIRQLSEMMYEDELDDAQEDPTQNYQRLTTTLASESDEDEEDGPSGNEHQTAGGGRSPGAGSRTPPPNPAYMTNNNKGAPVVGGGKKKKAGAAGGGSSSGGGGKKYESKPKNADQKKKIRQQRRQGDRDK